VTDHSRCSALHIAAQRKNTSILLRLLASGGDLMARNCYNLSALQELQLSRPRLFPLNMRLALSGEAGGGTQLSHRYKTIANSINVHAARQEQRKHDLHIQRLSAELAVELGVARDKLIATPSAGGLGRKPGFIRTRKIQSLLLKGARLDRGHVHLRSLLWHIRYVMVLRA